MTVLGGNQDGGGGQAGGNGGVGDSGAANAGGGGGAASGNSGGQGGNQASWRDSLPEELKGHSTLLQIQDIPALAKSYVETKALVGKKGVIMPGEKATEAEWNAFYDSLGRPALDKFDVKVPEGRKIHEDTLKAFKENMHRAGLTPKQAQEVLNFYEGRESQQEKDRNESASRKTEENVATLKKEWGEAFDHKARLANRPINELGGDEFKSLILESGLGNSPAMARFLLKVEGLMQEDGLRGEAAGKFGLTPDEIQQQIDAITQATDSPYWKASHPAHQSTVEKVNALRQRLAASHQQKSA